MTLEDRFASGALRLRTVPPEAELEDRFDRGKREVLPQGPEGRSSREQSPRSLSPAPRLLPWLIALLLVLSTLVVYRPVRNHEFIHFDDLTYVTHNPHVRAGLTLRGVTQAFTSTRATNWHPLTWLSHMMDVELYGLSPGGHHLINVFFHIANTLLLFLVLKWMTGTLWQSSFVAALFALHPLHVESVAWVSERKDVLSALFWMLTMWAYVRYVEHKVKGQRSKVQGKTLIDPCLQRYLLVLLFFVLGLMSKPMLVTLPFVLLLLDYWPLDRFQPDHWRTQTWPLVREKIPLFFFSAASSVATYTVQRGAGALASTDILPFTTRLANALVSYVSYIVKMIWPRSLALYYPYPQTLPLWKVAGAALLLLGITFGVIRLGRKYRYLPVGWFWYLGTLVPVIGLVQAGSQSMADRYTYVPLIGLFIMVAIGLPHLVSRMAGRNLRLAIPAVIALMVLLLVSRTQISLWQNTFRIFEHTLAVTTNNAYFHNMLGMALVLHGNLHEGIVHFTEALKISPRYLDARNNLGLTLEKQGRIDEAIAAYFDVLRTNPDDSEAHYNLGNVLGSQGKPQEAIFHLTQALRIKPDYAEAHNNLGSMLTRQGRTDEAIAHYAEAVRIKPEVAEAGVNLALALEHRGRVEEAFTKYQEALRLNPRSAAGHYNFGNFLLRHGRFDEAIVHYAEALKNRPDYAEAQNNWGAARQRQGKLNEALVHYEEAVKINPNHSGAHNNLGNLFLLHGKIPEALDHFNEALRIKPDLLEARKNLGNALSRLGKPREAIAQYTKALEISPDDVEAHFALGMMYVESGDRNLAFQEYKALRGVHSDLAHRLLLKIPGW